MNMQDSTRLVFQRLNVWALAVGSAVSAVVVMLLAWPLKLLMHHEVRTDMHEHADYYAVHHGDTALWHLGMLVVIALWAGIGGAVVAAVYNAVAARQRR